MNVVVAFVVGFVIVRAVAVAGRDFLAAEALQRRNYRDHLVPTGGGILLAVALVVIAIPLVLVAAFGSSLVATLLTLETTNAITDPAMGMSTASTINTGTNAGIGFAT